MDGKFKIAIRNIVENWADWKKQHYNNYFAISPYAEKLIINYKGGCQDRDKKV